MWEKHFRKQLFSMLNKIITNDRDKWVSTIIVITNSIQETQLREESMGVPPENAREPSKRCTVCLILDD
jgi:hypothetical protein